MFRMKTILTAVIATVGMLFATNESQAQNFGVNLNFGRAGFSYYQNDYSYAPYVYTPPVCSNVWTYPSYRRHHHHHHDHSVIIPGASAVVPERYHWTPYRGLHTHGSVYAPTYSGGVLRIPY